MTVSLETLEQLITDDSDELAHPGWLSTASAEAFTACYVAARQGGIEITDLLHIAISCEQLMAFLIRRVLTDIDIKPAQRLVYQRSFRWFMMPSERAAYYMLETWVARKMAESNT